MTVASSVNLPRVLFALSLGTALSLMGDTALYAVLPTRAAEAGVKLVEVGVLLSANRWIRLLLNGPAGWAYDRWPHRWLFTAALFVGTLSTALYGWTQGFWPLLIGRLLWGAAWSGIWVGGNTIVLDVAGVEQRGRLTGLYQLSFYLGSTLGFPVGGVLTDWLGFRPAMMIAAIVTGIGALVAALLLPETRRAVAVGSTRREWRRELRPQIALAQSAPAAPAMLLYAANRFVIAGVVSASLGLLIQQRWGATPLGVATLTGLLLGLNTLISMSSAPLAGGWSDRRASRWPVVALGLAPGVVGMLLLSIGHPLAIVSGVMLAALAGGSNQSLATTLLGDVTASEWRGRALGWMHTFGDFSSAVAPPLVYAVWPVVGLPAIYAACAVLLAALMLWAARRGHETG